MKKVLLTTTALVMTAGVSSAEITFSGKGEAGFYRNAPTAAVAAGTAPTAGSYSATYTNTDETGAISFTATGALATATAAAEGTARAAYLAALDAHEAAATTTTLEALQKAQMDLEVVELNQAYQTASAAVAKGATPTLSAYSGYDMNAAVSGASDNGMTFSFGFDMGAGMIADQDDDRAMDAQGAAVTNDQLTIGYAGYTIEIGDDLIDDVYDDSQNGDVALSGSLGDLTFKIVHDMDKDVEAVAATYASYTAPAADLAGTYTAGTAATAAVYNTTSYSLGYTMGDVAFAMASTDHDDRGNAASSFSLTYTVSDALSATYSVDNVGTFKDIAKLAATAKISDMLSITASVKDDKDHALNTNTGGKQSQDVSISYAAGSLGATIATDESSNWWVNAQYDLGGGAQAFTTFDHSEFLVAGVNFAF